MALGIEQVHGMPDSYKIEILPGGQFRRLAGPYDLKSGPPRYHVDVMAVDAHTNEGIHLSVFVTTSNGSARLAGRSGEADRCSRNRGALTGSCDSFNSLKPGLNLEN